MHSNKVMKIQTTGTVTHYSFEHLCQWPELTQAAFGRGGGVSEAPYDTLNISYAVQDDPGRVKINRERMARAVGWNPSCIVSAHQVHGRDVVAVGREMVGQPDIRGTDALVTNESGVLLLLKFADCVPVVLWDPVKRVVGLAHAGWRGTMAGTPAAALEMMADRYGTRPSDVLAGIGPSIGPCCYQVGPEVVSAASERFAGAAVLHPDGTGAFRLDLWAANMETLMRVGLAEENIAVAGICTRCRSDLFFSHRAAGGLAGRFGFVAGIRDE